MKKTKLKDYDKPLLSVHGNLKEITLQEKEEKPGDGPSLAYKRS